MQLMSKKKHKIQSITGIAKQIKSLKESVFVFKGNIEKWLFLLLCLNVNDNNNTYLNHFFVLSHMITRFGLWCVTMRVHKIYTIYRELKNEKLIYNSDM